MIYFFCQYGLHKMEYNYENFIYQVQLNDENLLTYCLAPDCFILIQKLTGQKRFINEKRELNILVKCLTGHVALNKQEYRLGHISSPKCQFREEAESADHFLLKCERYQVARMLNLGEHAVQAEKVHNMRLRQIINYIKETKHIDTMD